MPSYRGHCKPRKSRWCAPPVPREVRDKIYSHLLNHIDLAFWSIYSTEDCDDYVIADFRHPSAIEIISSDPKRFLLSKASLPKYNIGTEARGISVLLV